jgi:hypothetical protein
MPHRRSHFAAANSAEMVSFETTAQLLENLWVNRAGAPFARLENGATAVRIATRRPGKTKGAGLSDAAPSSIPAI